MARPCHVLFDNNILPRLIGADSQEYLTRLMKCLWDRFPQSRIDAQNLSVGAIVTPSTVIETLDLPKKLSSEPNYQSQPKDRLGDFRERCIQEHLNLLPDTELDSRITNWINALPKTHIRLLLEEHFQDFCSSGRHAGIIREYLAIHRLLSYPYPDDNDAHPYLLVQTIRALRDDGFVPLLRLARAIATSFGSSPIAKKKGWYNNPELRLKPQADHLDTELLQVALFGAGKKQEHSAVCITNDPPKKVRARINLVMQVLIEYEGWAQDQEELEPAPLPLPGYVVFPSKDFSQIEEIIDVHAEIKPFLIEDEKLANN